MAPDQTQMESPKAAKERELELAVARLKYYVERRKQMRGLDDEVHRIVGQRGGRPSSVLQLSDIETILEAQDAD